MNRLRELRIERKESQRDIAEILGITQQAYSYYESDKRKLDPDSLKILSNHFQVSVDYLIDNSDIKEKTPSKQQASLDNIDEERLDEELIDALCKLNDEELNQVTSFVQFLLSSPRE